MKYKSKRSENGVITNPFFLTPDESVYEAEALMGKYRISGVPIVKDEESRTLVGIITNRDLRFIEDFSIKISDVMTKENLITAPVGTTLDEAEAILQKHKIEKLPLVEKGRLEGLITIKDMKKYLNSLMLRKMSMVVYLQQQLSVHLKTPKFVHKTCRSRSRCVNY